MTTPSTLSSTTRWRLVLLLTAATASTLIAGCCGGPLSADGSDCSGCVCDDQDADAGDAGDAGDASDADDDAADMDADASEDAG